MMRIGGWQMYFRHAFFRISYGRKKIIVVCYISAESCARHEDMPKAKWFSATIKIQSLLLLSGIDRKDLVKTIVMSKLHPTYSSVTATPASLEMTIRGS